MDVTTTKQAIATVVKQNGVGSITGPNMQTTLFRLLDDVNNGKSDKVPTSANGDLLKGDANGNPVSSGITTASVSGHLANTNNPHSVTKSQIGLGNVDNTADMDKPVSTDQAAAIGVVNNALTAHKNRTDNPHSVTKAQVGLDNVDNTSDLNKPISNATQAALNQKANSADLQSHLDNHNNPHQVTKAAIGLGNVDNTSDANKPISTATATALNTKQDNNATRLAAWKALYGNLDLSVSTINDLATFFSQVLYLQGTGDYTSEAPFQGVMVQVHVLATPSLLAVTWSWAGECYGKKRGDGNIVKYGIEEMYTPDYSVDFNTDFRV